MRLSEPIEATGLFWWPEQPDSRLSGVLKISESSEITVELAGIVGNPLATLIGDEPAPTRLMGVLQKGGPITIDGCFQRNATTSFPSGLSTSVVSAHRALIGAQYEDQEAPVFSEFSFSIEGLDTWLWISGIEVETDFANLKGLIRYHVPDDVSLGSVKWS